MKKLFENGICFGPQNMNCENIQKYKNLFRKKLVCSFEIVLKSIRIQEKKTYANQCK